MSNPTISSNIDTDSDNSFTIIISNLMILDDDGGATLDNIPSSYLPLPNSLITNGAPSNLKDLKKLVGSENINIKYYAKINGTMTSFNCGCTYYLQMKGAWSGDQQDSKIRYTTIFTTTSNNTQPIDTEWIKLETTSSDIILDNARVQRFDNSVSACSVCAQEPGFDGCSVSVRVAVTVNLRNFCITMGKDYMYNTICYNYTSNWLSNNGQIADQQTTDYLADYCNRKYPNANLDIFNPDSTMDQRDYKLCACNMPDSLYTEFKKSLTAAQPAAGSVNSHCLFTPCYESVFKGIDLDGCPQPQCVNYTSLNANDISGDVTVNQDSECVDYYIEPPSAPPSASSRSSTDRSTTNNDDGWPLWIYLILIVFFIIFVMIIIIILMSSKKKKSPKLSY